VESLKSAELIIKFLESKSIKYIFGLPGEENLVFLDAIAKSNLEFILCKHEQAAGFMAANYARLSGKPAVFFTTLGPGTTNGLTAMAFAKLSNIPVIMISGQKNQLNYDEGLFQIMDLTEMLKPYTKTSLKLTNEDFTLPILNQLYLDAEQHHEPTFLELPKDISERKVKLADGYTLNVNSSAKLNANTDDVLAIAKLISKSKQPVIVIGAEANYLNINKALEKFLEDTKIPFITSQMGKGLIDDKHELALGCAFISKNNYIHEALAKSDLIILIGNNPHEKPVFLSQNLKVKTISLQAKHLKLNPAVDVSYELIGDLSKSLIQLASEIEAKSTWQSLVEFTKPLKAEFKERFSCQPSFPLKPYSLVDTLSKSLPADACICLDNGMYKLWFAAFYEARHRHSILLDNTLASMGAGLPNGISTKLFYPEREVVVVTGDGGFAMCSQELETAVRLGIKLTILVLKDSEYHMIDWKQEKEGLAEFGLEFNDIDYLKFAESFGAKGIKLSGSFSLNDALEIDYQGVKLVEVPIDYTAQDCLVPKNNEQHSTQEITN
jgi:acetolactate synthase-1/2/3 large subunit